MDPPYVPKWPDEHAAVVGEGTVLALARSSFRRKARAADVTLGTGQSSGFVHRGRGMGWSAPVHSGIVATKTRSAACATPAGHGVVGTRQRRVKLNPAREGRKRLRETSPTPAKRAAGTAKRKPRGEGKVHPLEIRRRGARTAPGSASAACAWQAGGPGARRPAAGGSGPAGDAPARPVPAAWRRRTAARRRRSPHLPDAARPAPDQPSRVVRHAPRLRRILPGQDPGPARSLMPAARAANRDFCLVSEGSTVDAGDLVPVEVRGLRRFAPILARTQSLRITQQVAGTTRLAISTRGARGTRYSSGSITRRAGNAIRHHGDSRGEHLEDAEAERHRPPRGTRPRRRHARAAAGRPARRTPGAPPHAAAALRGKTAATSSARALQHPLRADRKLDLSAWNVTRTIAAASVGKSRDPLARVEGADEADHRFPRRAGAVSFPPSSERREAERMHTARS